VASELSDQYDIVIFGGPDEQDIALDIEKLLIKKDVKNYKNLAGKTTIPELINHISNLDLFITGDSGPMHVAAAFQIPTVAIFGPTKDNETSQWMNEKSIIVKKGLDCQPCMQRACPLQHHNCMKLITSVEVLDAVNGID
jgi:heptosyltransferase-2